MADNDPYLFDAMSESQIEGWTLGVRSAAHESVKLTMPGKNLDEYLLRLMHHFHRQGRHVGQEDMRNRCIAAWYDSAEDERDFDVILAALPIEGEDNTAYTPSGFLPHDPDEDDPERNPPEVNDG